MVCGESQIWFHCRPRKMAEGILDHGVLFSDIISRHKIHI